MFNEMEIQIHRLEQEAYCAVLRAFKAQGDAITWDKESLITELRKELRVSVDEHRDLLNHVNADNVVKRIRECRQSVVHQAAMHNTSHAMMHSAPLRFHSMNAPVGPASLNQESGPSRSRIIPKANIPEEIELFDTDTLIKEVERVFSSSNPDPALVELAKKRLREQEQALVDAISVLATATEGDSDEKLFPYGHQQ